MKPKYETGHQMGNTPKPLVVLMLAFFPLLGIGLMILAVYSGYHAAVSLTGVILCLAIGAFVLGWSCIAAGMARYRFESAGLSVKYPLCASKLIPWQEFQQVCVCRAAFTTRGEKKANTVICCVKNGEKKNLHGRWKTDNLLRYRRVICIEYTPELHAGIVEKCPYEVADLRDSRAYRLS